MTNDLPGARRRSPRVPVHLSGSLSGRSRRAVTIADVSLTGCLVRCDSLLDHGAILDLTTELDGEPFVAKVRVTGASVDGAPASTSDGRCVAGLDFLSLPPLQAARLRRFIEQERQRKRGADPIPE